MLEALMTRGSERADARAAARMEALAASISIPGVMAFVEDGRVVLQGRAIARRFATEPNLRWRLGEMRHGR